MLNLHRALSRPLRLRQDPTETADASRDPKHQTSDDNTVPFDCFGRAAFQPGAVKSKVSSREVLSIDDIVMSASSDGSMKAQQRREGGDRETEQLHRCLI